MHEHKWMLHLGCCKLEIPILPWMQGASLLYLMGTAICGADDKTEVLSFTLGCLVTIETEVLFHKAFAFYSSEIVHSNILRKMLTDSLLKDCICSDCHWCHKKAAHRCKPQAV